MVKPDKNVFFWVFFSCSCFFQIFIAMNVYWLLCFDWPVFKTVLAIWQKGHEKEKSDGVHFYFIFEKFQDKHFLGSPFLLITIIYVFTSTDQSVFSADHGFTFVILHLYMVNTDTNENEESSLCLTIYWLSCVSSTF